MQVLLIPVDGSEYSLRAVEYAARRSKAGAEPTRLHLLNVQPPIVTVNVKLFVSQESLEQYYREEGAKAIGPAKALLDAHGLTVTPHIGVGDAGKIICDYATEIAASEIIMGTHGRGVLAGSLMGSVAQKVAHLAPVPLVLVK
ncbi:MAG: universal stress protein [Gammaproteobacteria bacterium]|nr:universal stress protein [Gammaproteobacteria bacterium]